MAKQVMLCGEWKCEVPKFRRSTKMAFQTEALLHMPHFSCSLVILGLFFIMTGITPDMTGNQLSCLSSKKSRGNASKKSDYVPSPLLHSLFAST
jgi:hypothetical protein